MGADFGELSPAEQQLLDEMGQGTGPDGAVEIGADRPGPDAGAERQVRGSFLRYLMLGGCDALRRPVPEHGVRLQGARITGAAVTWMHGILGRLPHRAACNLGAAMGRLYVRINAPRVDD